MTAVWDELKVLLFHIHNQDQSLHQCWPRTCKLAIRSFRPVRAISWNQSWFSFSSKHPITLLIKEIPKSLFLRLRLDIPQVSQYKPLLLLKQIKKREGSISGKAESFWESEVLLVTRKLLLVIQRREAKLQSETTVSKHFLFGTCSILVVVSSPPLLVFLRS